MAEAKECEACGAANDTHASSCWLCGRELEEELREGPAQWATKEPAIASPLDRAGERAPISFSLKTLMLVVTWFAFFCGLEVVTRGLGYVLIMASLPALLRKAGLERKERPVEPVMPQNRHASLDSDPATLLFVIALVAVIVGTFAVGAGPGILLAIASLPILIRSTVVIRKREAAALPVSPGKRVILVVSSLFAQLVTVAVVCIAAFGTFCGISLLGLSGSDDLQLSGIGLAISIICFSVLMGAMVLGRQWAKARSRQDTRVPNQR